jgi:hypothetical protein
MIARMSTATQEKKAVDLVLDHLCSDDLSTSCCLYTLIGAITSVFNPAGIWNKKDRSDKEKMRQLARLSEITVGWITQLRSTNKIASLAMIECNCLDDGPLKTWHNHGVSAYEMHGAAQHTHPRWYFFVLCLQPFIHYQHTRKRQEIHRLDKLDSRDMWPTTTESVLIQHPEETIRGLIQWYTLELGPVERQRLANALEVVIAVCYPLVLTFLACDDSLFRLCFLNSIQQDKCLLDAREKESWMVVKMSTFATIKLMERLMGVLSHVERGFFYLPDPRGALRAYEDTMEMSRFNRQRTRSSGQTQNFETTDQYTDVIKSLREQLIMDFPVLSDTTSKTALPISPRLRSSNHTWDDLRHMMEVLLRSQQCAFPGCSTTMANITLRECSGCKMIRYCSRRCQKRAWTHMTAPHRESCVALKSASWRFRGRRFTLDEVFVPTPRNYVPEDRFLTVMKYHENLDLSRLRVHGELCRSQVVHKHVHHLVPQNERLTIQ